MHIWGRQHPQNMLGQISKIWREMEYVPNDISSNTNIQIQQKLDEALLPNELYPQQRSRVDLLQSGDRNTSFFHNKVSSRFQRTMISTLQDKWGHWNTNDQIFRGHSP